MLLRHEASNLIARHHFTVPISAPAISALSQRRGASSFSPPAQTSRPPPDAENNRYWRRQHLNLARDDKDYTRGAVLAITRGCGRHDRACDQQAEARRRTISTPIGQFATRDRRR